MTDKKQPFPIQLKSELLAREDEFAATLKSIGIDEQRFIRVGLLYVTQNRNLWKCIKSSIVLALLESARAGLMVDGKQAAILPYKDQATFMPMTFGIIALMLRSPKVLKIEARAVYDGDEFAFRYGIRPNLEHTPQVIPSDDALTYAYAVMWRERAPEPTFEVMSREEIEIIRATSRNANHSDSPWVNWYSEMARKSAVKRLSKYADLAPEAQQAIQMDHEIFGDPGMGSYAEGLSDDYQNQLTKRHTQAGIDDLKDRMENGDSEKVEVEPDPEPDPEPEAEPFTPEEEMAQFHPEPRPKNKWEPEIVDFIMETQLVDGKDAKQVKLHIRKVLNRSPFMDTPFGDLDLVLALAFVIGRSQIMGDYPQLESKARYALLLEWWADDEKRNDLIDRALVMIPPEEPTE